MFQNKRNLKFYTNKQTHEYEIWHKKLFPCVCVYYGCTGFQFSKSCQSRGRIGNSGLQMQCGCIKSDQTKLWTLALANLPITEADQKTKCGKCTVTNVTVVIQFFRFQSKFKRWLIVFSEDQHLSTTTVMGKMESSKIQKSGSNFGRSRIWPDSA